MNVFSYLRVSGLGQVDKDGPVRQRASIKAFADSFGLIVLQEFFDEGVSGTVECMERPGFADMLTKVIISQNTPFPIEAIVVECMDRLARDLMISEMLLKTCRENKVKVFCSVDSGLIDVASEADQNRTMLRQILAIVAQWDKTNTVEKLRSARLRMRAEGRRCEGSKPYGYFPAEKPVLERMKALHRKMSLSELAFALNCEGFRNRAGRQWTKASVFSILTGQSLATAKKARKNNARRIHAVSSDERLAAPVAVSGPSGTGPCAETRSGGVAQSANTQPCRTVNA
jgi:site-specific DNA recombinase